MWLIGNRAVAINGAAALRSGGPGLSRNDNAGGFDDRGEAGFCSLEDRDRRALRRVGSSAARDGDAEQAGGEQGRQLLRKVARGERIHWCSIRFSGGPRYRKGGDGAKRRRRLGLVIAECGVNFDQRV
jgi:hypothetical protein